jgi:hypothetical protein
MPAVLAVLLAGSGPPGFPLHREGGYQSLIESVKLRASSVVGNIQSAFSSAATAIPTDLLSEVAGILPTEIPAQTTSGAISGTESYLGLTLAMAGAAVVGYAVD